MPSLMNSFFRVSGEIQSLLYDTAGEYSVSVPAGQYKIVCRGGGGAGGENGVTKGGAGGAGGAGGKGLLNEETVVFANNTTLTVRVGRGGYTYANGGNGGAGGTGNSSGVPGGNGGAGGGGGIGSEVLNSGTVINRSKGGGGGGGGGGGTTITNARNAYGAGGGGGGGEGSLYGSAVHVGASGGNAGLWNGNGYAGWAGDSTTYPTIYAGHGGGAGSLSWERSVGGAGGTGGGAGGGGGASNGLNEDYSYGGPGGGGAGGDLDAGGGACGQGRSDGTATNGYNHHTEPTDVSAENAEYGASAESGRGGTTNTNGNDGFVYIERIG